MKPTFLIYLTLFVTLSSPNLSATQQKSTPQQQLEGLQKLEGLQTPPKNKSQKCKIPKEGRYLSPGESYEKEGTKYICLNDGKWDRQMQN